MRRDDKVSLVEIAGFYVLYFEKDHALTHILGDARSHVVRYEDVKIGWKVGEVDVDGAWSAHGMGTFSLAAIHYWRHGIDFDYVDVGANVGLTALIQGVFHKRCGRNNRIYAFEPGEVFPLLQAAIRLNGIGDITTCIRAAVSDQPGKVEFYVTPAQSPASSLLQAATSRPGVVESNVVRVDAVTFDQFAKQLRPAGGLLCKIDAEGADFKVLDGMRDTLRDRICTLQIELYPALVDTYTDPVARLTELADEFVMIDVGATPFHRIDTSPPGIAAFVERVRGLEMPTTDILLVPKKLPAAENLITRVITG